MIDVEAIKRNAAEQGIPLREIPIVYSNLKPEEVIALNEQNLIARWMGKEVLIGRFTESGEMLFSDKATGVLYLGA